MKFLNITPGIESLNDAGFSKFSNDEKNAFKTRVLERDNHTCQFCGFHAQKYQDIQIIKKPTEANPNIENYVTACVFCQQCFNLNHVADMQSGALIWLPEISQAALHHICRSIYVARITQGPMADAARKALETLMSRRDDARQRLGTDDPFVLSSLLMDYIEPAEYKLRAEKLKGIRVLPLDRRIIKDGDLEFNQFPQILAFWRSKNGPYGQIPPRDWEELWSSLGEKQAG